MIKAYTTAAVLLVLAPSAALAQRAGDAALGAVAGAVVLGRSGQSPGLSSAIPPGLRSRGLGDWIDRDHHGTGGKPRRTVCEARGRKPSAPATPPRQLRQCRAS